MQEWVGDILGDERSKESGDPAYDVCYGESKSCCECWKSLAAHEITHVQCHAREEAHQEYQKCIGGFLLFLAIHCQHYEEDYA